MARSTCHSSIQGDEVVKGERSDQEGETSWIRRLSRTTRDDGGKEERRVFQGTRVEKEG